MKNKNLVILVVIYVVILVIIGIFQPREIDWTPTFSGTDKIPYGAYVLRERLTDIFPDSSIRTTSESAYKTLHKKHYSHTNYILIEPQWNASRNDVKELLNFAAEGNTVFIASQNIPFRLLDTIGIHLVYAMPNFLQKITKTDTSSSLPVRLVNRGFGKDSLYEFETSNIPEYFSNADRVEKVINQLPINEDDEASVKDTAMPPLAPKADVLSTMSDTNPIFIRVPIGKGFIYLHSYPYAFSNYYLLKASTRGYAERCLSYLPKGKVLWDEHYKTDPALRHVTTLSYILNNPSLSWGYYTGILFLLIFVVFSIKRRQRIIPVVAPFRNTTLEFTETIGRLYFNRGDSKNIAEKKIRHFLEYVRSRYYVDTKDLNTEFISKLSNKSGIEHDRVKYMAEVMRALLTRQSIADSELIQLNELIEYFKKHSN